MLKEQRLLLNIIDKITTEYNEIMEKHNILLKELEKKATYDNLTSLYNRTKFFDTVNQLENKNICILFIDLDNFKEANDTYGHEIGDKILISFSNLMKKFFKGKDVIGRLGGDEFVVAVLDCNKINIVKILDKFLKVIRSEFKEYNITASIGVSFYPDENKNIKEVLKIADTRMYKVKQKSRNGFCIE